MSDPALETKLAAADIAVLTGGRDKHYSLGLAVALRERGISFEFLGSDLIDAPELHDSPLITFRNLRGDQSENAPAHQKVVRVLRYYGRLISYAVLSRPTVFHILWNNKFEWFDRTILMGLYRLCGRKVVFTAHNVNIGERDGRDSPMNRLTLAIQYRLASAIFVHTEQMSRQLQDVFHVPVNKIQVIPFPLNNAVPDTAMDGSTARASLGIGPEERVLLFYGQVAPYKGLEYLVQSLVHLRKTSTPYRLLIAGRIKKNAEDYWKEIQETISRSDLAGLILSRIEFIPDEETEIYFKAADVLVLPYVYIFQSGVLFLSYNFGLPVLAADVGSLKENIVEGRTGFVFRPKDPLSLARTIEVFFDSELYRNLPDRRKDIRGLASQNNSWNTVASSTIQVYGRLLNTRVKERLQRS